MKKPIKSVANLIKTSTHTILGRNNISMTVNGIELRGGDIATYAEITIHSNIKEECRSWILSYYDDYKMKLDLGIVRTKSAYNDQVTNAIITAFDKIEAGDIGSEMIKKHIEYYDDLDPDTYSDIVENADEMAKRLNGVAETLKAIRDKSRAETEAAKAA